MDHPNYIRSEPKRPIDALRIKTRKTRVTLFNKRMRRNVAALQELMDEAMLDPATRMTLEQLRQAKHYRQVLNEGNGHRRDVLRKIQRSRHRDFLIGAIARSYEEELALSQEMLSA